MNKKNLLIYCIVFAFLVVASDICYMLIDCSAYITKTIASIIFVIFGAINLYLIWDKFQNNAQKYFAICMVIGLIFACAGDIFLIDNFILGAILFAIGHIFYLIAFIFLTKYKWFDIVSSIIIFAFALCVILLYPNFEFNGMKLLVIVYALIISAMLGKALSNFIYEPSNIKNIIIALGAFLFFFSDLMLLFEVFAINAVIFDVLCLATYYPAEYLLGLALLIKKKP